MKKKILIIGGVLVGVCIIVLVAAAVIDGSSESSQSAAEKVTLPDWNLIEKDSQKILIAGMTSKESCYRAAQEYGTGDNWDCGYNCKEPWAEYGENHKACAVVCTSNGCRE